VERVIAPKLTLRLSKSLQRYQNQNWGLGYSHCPSFSQLPVTAYSGIIPKKHMVLT